MTTRGNVGGALLTIAMTAALWACSSGVASAQWPCGGEGQPVCPPGVVSCPDAATACTDDCSVTCTATYTPDQKVNVFTFGTNNSIQIKFNDVTCPSFDVTVELLPTSQEAFQRRVTPPPDGVCPFTDTNRPYPATPEIECNVSVDNQQNDGLVDNCAVYHVSFSPPSGCYTAGPTVVGYTIGWQDPVVKKNKHDYMLLRDPDTGCFTQDITDKLIRNYDVGTIVDPGLGGRTCCPSEYVVARQRVRPAR